MLVIKLRDFYVIAIKHICDAILHFTLIVKWCRSLFLSTKATSDLSITPVNGVTIVPQESRAFLSDFPA